MPTLEWIGKDKVINHHQEVPFKVLENEYSYSEDGVKDGESTSGNKIIRGDNLEALKSLLPLYMGKIKCIYIDPPYNTGNEKWVYNDNVNHPKIKKWLGDVVGKEGEDLSRHDKWLCMIYPRLKLLNKLLHPQNGVIFISIDDNEYSNLKLICDEIFGSNCYVSTIAWQKRYSRENREAIGDVHEYILVYAKDKKVFKETRNLIEMNEKQAKVYKNPNNDPKGRWRPIPMTAQAGHATKDQFYPITAPGGKVFYPPEGRCWSIVESTFKDLLKEGRIYFGKNNNSQPNTIRYLSEVDGVVPWTWWPHEEVGNTDSAKKEIYSILGKGTKFETPKPTQLIERIIRIATSKDNNDIILDSFAGTGTTAHAVLNLNKKDGGNRKFILVEMEDYADTITAERVKRVIDGYSNVEATGGDFNFYSLGEPLLIENQYLNENVEVKKIREYVFYTETNKTLNLSEDMGNEYYLGEKNGRAYYFYYKKDESTTLDYKFLSTITVSAESYVIYADTNLLSKDELEKFNIVFKKIPRDIARI
ncbi:site-specific DNA-methyltransferase [Brevibacillus sp. MS2.2]|uniref:site-specific DNA-methyltransferase n=1 Tax=Brevibacillus sp. MS2.2 TaxID=2738981 RepID=UPI00156AA7B9|nr:site-specific DNA-methyltransferase [Brevibacillus sp. MS2.2]NRR22882.1 site-specific DNA-methyltransferase [Brevibacillus sp. MS2.2]